MLSRYTKLHLLLPSISVLTKASIDKTSFYFPNTLSTFLLEKCERSSMLWFSHYLPFTFQDDFKWGKLVTKTRTLKKTWNHWEFEKRQEEYREISICRRSHHKDVLPGLHIIIHSTKELLNCVEWAVLTRSGEAEEQCRAGPAWCFGFHTWVFLIGYVRNKKKVPK